MAGAASLLAARGAGLKGPNLIVAIATVIGFAPALTWFVELIRGTRPAA